MIPESLATLYALLGLVAPGVVFQLVAERMRPSRRDSAFREAALVAVTSLVFTTTSVLLLAWVSRSRPSWFVNLQLWVGEGDKYLAHHLWIVVWSLGAEVLLAVLLAVASALALERFVSDEAADVAKSSVWWAALKHDSPEGMAAWVRADLVDGTVIWGYVHRFTLEETGDDRDISFQGPGLTIQRSGRKEKKTRETYYKYFVVRASEVRMLSVAHEIAK